MATFKIVVLPHQKKEDGTYNVKIRVTQNRKSKYIKTSQYVTASDITKKKERGAEKIKVKNQAIIDLMDEIVLSYRRRLVEAGPQAEQWDVDKVVEYLTKEKEVFRLDILEYGRKHADSLERKGRLGTARQYRISMNALERFAGSRLDVNDITVSFLKSFEKHLLEEPAYKGTRIGKAVPTDKMKTSMSIRLYMAHLRFLFNQAKLEFNDEEAGEIRIPLSPFGKYKTPATTPGKHRVLTVEQIQQIIDLPYKKLSKNFSYSTFVVAKDVFLLSFGLMGMNTADLYELNSFSDGIITYERRKTRTRRADKAMIKVKVEPELLPLFDKYKGKDTVFKFNERYKDSETFNRMVNTGLKAVGKEIGIPGLNFYYARHTMASICANKLGIDIARVDEMLNHSEPQLALARVYIEKDFKPLWEANRKLIDLFDWSFYTKEKPED